MKLLLVRILILAGCIFSYQNTFACQGPTGVLPGQCAPNFKVQTMEGKTVELYQLRGKVVALNFWATWCKPCLVEMPSMQKAYQSLKKGNFEMLAISIDSNPKEIQGFLDNQLQKKLDFLIALDPKHQVSSIFGSSMVPETFIIDKTGKITDKVIGIREWDDSLIINYLKLLSR